MRPESTSFGISKASLPANGGGGGGGDGSTARGAFKLPLEASFKHLLSTTLNQTTNIFTMAAPSEIQQVYIAEDFSEPTAPQYEFPQHYDLNDPDSARLSYQRLMHEHTKQQFELATSSARRRGSPPEHDISSLRKETSGMSIDSTSSS
ncbi:unnamed protein product [Aureobasidium pullulans]|nr:unnamed protein product [Aureobasidium pullulans]